MACNGRICSPLGLFWAGTFWEKGTRQINGGALTEGPGEQISLSEIKLCTGMG